VAGYQANRICLVNPWCDFLLAGGISAIVFVLFLFVGHAFSKGLLEWLALFTLWFANWPHFSVTLHRLYHSRTSRVEYSFASWGLPFLMVFALFLAFEFPDVVAPALAKLYLLWSPYHYSAQTFGVSILYARRAGLRVTPFERTSIALFAHACAAVAVVRTETKVWENHFFALTIKSLELPSWFLPISYLVMGLGSLFVIISLGRWWKRSLCGFPWLAIVPLMTQLSWSFVQPVPGFELFIPLFHSVQYLFVAGFMHLAEESPSRINERNPKWCVWEILRWVRQNLVGGAILFWGVPTLSSLMGFRYDLAKPIIWTAINLHHFIVDGIIWKMRKPSVNTPLSLTLSQLLTPWRRSV